MVLTATVVAAGPGAAWASDAKLRPPGWAAGSVRFEPLEAGPGGLTVAGTGTYRGTVEVRRNGRSLAVVNDLGLEDYVRGIDEVPPGWPAAALQAQAIAARTYAAHKAGDDTTPWRAVGADICATPTCQVYRGLDAERRAQGHGWLPAVEATAGRALLAGDRPILASYSATANGPLAMSQNGALAMALQGRSASDILGAYYGVRPTLAPSRLPSTISVALVMGSSSVRISATGPFRVVDGSGVELAASAAGEWRVVPGPGGVQVVPPGTHPLTVPVLAAEASAVRRPGRVITAATPLPRQAPWAATALAHVLAAGAAAVTLDRRRRTERR